MSYPTDISSFSNPVGTTLIATDDHAKQHRIEGSAIVSLENKVGLGAGSAAANQVLVGSGAGTAAWGSVWNLAQLGTATIGTPSITGGTVTASLLGTNQVTGGTLASAAIGTPTIIGGTIAIDGTATPLSVGAALAPTVVTLTDAAGGTITPNAQAGQIFHLILGTTAGNRTLENPDNLATDGVTVNFRIKQNAGDTGTILYGNKYRFSDAGTPVLGTAATYNYLGWRYNSIDDKLDYVGKSISII